MKFLYCVAINTIGFAIVFGFKTHHFIFSVHKTCLTTLKTDLDKLTAHVCQKYPDDKVLKNWATYYNQTGRAGLHEMIHAPVNRKSMTNEEKKRQT